jgi:hypothetical protein
MADPLFFFSYARGSYKNAEGGRFTAAEQNAINSIDEFYHALCREVADRSGKSADEVGFRDQQDLELSAPWPVRLTEALGSAVVMVALFTPTYFLRPACGREFEFFRRRQRALEMKLGCALDHRILPVLWTRPDGIYESIPSICRADVFNLQLMPPGAPACYTDWGLKSVFNNQKRAEWNKVCELIADRIWKLARAQTLPTLGSVDLNSLPSAFHEPPMSPGLPRPVDPDKREIRVYYLVPTKVEWSEVSGANNSEFDERREGARPFSDTRDVDIARATQDGIAAIKPELGVTHEALPDDIAQALKNADDTMTTPLLIFDRRALRIPTLEVAANAYAEGEFENTGFVTVAGGEVPELEINALRDRKAGASPKLHLWSVPAGCREYVHNVASVVAELEMQLIRRQMEKLTPSGGAIPGLSGPSST